MQQDKFRALMNKVKFTGFPEGLEAPLKEMIAKGLDNFTLPHVGFSGKDVAKATLHFARSKETDNYFFNSYELEFKKEGQAQGLKQTFQIGWDNNITFREGLNLLAGRSVFKSMAAIINTGTAEAPRYEPKGEKSDVWLRLDTTDKDKHGNYLYKQYHQGYGFDLEKALVRHPIKELANQQDKEALIRTLQKGNLARVTFIIGGKEEKRYIEASAQFKSINQYDENFQRIGFRRNVNQSQSQGLANGTKQQQDQQQGPEQKQNRASRRRHALT